MRDPLKKVLSDSGEAEIFRNLVLRYVEIGASEGVRILPFLSPEMPLFQKASLEERQKAIEFLGTIVSIHEETIAAGNRAINSAQLIWRALRKLSLVPGPDVFDHITNEDVVIIYQENQTALFWNLQFFHYTSLTVEQMFFDLWYKFTKRDPAIQQTLYEMALDIISGKITNTFVPKVPGHVVEEIDTLECIRTWMELPFGSTLTRNGVLGGILIVQKMRILDT